MKREVRRRWLISFAATAKAAETDKAKPATIDDAVKSKFKNLPISGQRHIGKPAHYR